MKYSKIILCIAAITGMLAFQSCQKDADFLEEESFKWDDQSFYNTESDIIMGLNACYAQMEYLMVGNSHGQHSWMLQGMGLDTFSGTNGTAEWAANWPTIGNGNGTTRHWYDYGFNMINRCNTVIDMIDQRDKISYSTTDMKNQLRGEAVLLRAWAYRCMAGMFGNVPIMEHRTTEAKYDYSPSSRQDIWNFMREDLVWAEKNLPTTPRMTGTVTKAAAGTYLAEVCLALGKFDEAIEAANRVINKQDGDYAIMDKRFGSRASQSADRYGNSLAAPQGAYWDLFRQGGNQDLESGNKEAIWTVQYNYGTFETGGGGDSWWRVHSQATEAAWTPGILVGSQSTRVGTDGKMYYVYGDNIACYAPGASATSGVVTPVQKDGKDDPSQYVATAVGRHLANIAQDSLGARVSYLGQVCVPVKYIYTDLWDDPNDFRGSEVMIQRNWYTSGGTRFLDEKAKLYARKEITLTAGDTMNTFKPRLWKFSDDQHNGDNKSYDQELYMIRMPEVYLLLAEAYLAKDNKGEAAKAINVVRSRAGAKPCTAADIDIDYILDERTRELFGEEHRQITLNRLSCNPNCTYIKDCYPTQDATTSNTLYERVREYGAGFENVSNNPREKRTDGYGAYYSNITPHNYQYPIPTQVIQSNSGKEYPQNPGY